MNLTENLSDGNDVGCLGDDYCPPQCTCTGTIVRCSHAKLQEIPKVRPVQYSTVQYMLPAMVNKSEMQQANYSCWNTTM